MTADLVTLFELMICPNIFTHRATQSCGCCRRYATRIEHRMSTCMSMRPTQSAPWPRCLTGSESCEEPLTTHRLCFPQQFARFSKMETMHGSFESTELSGTSMSVTEWMRFLTDNGLVPQLADVSRAKEIFARSQKRDNERNTFT